MKPRFFYPVLAGLLAVATAGAADELDRGARAAAICAACHRLDGGDNGAPSIVGIDATQMIRRMQAFRSSDSENHSMHTVSRALSDEDIAAAAEYLAAHGTEAKSP